MGGLPSRPSWSTFARARPGLAFPRALRRTRSGRLRHEYVPMAMIVALVRAGLLTDFSRAAGTRV